MKSVLDSNTPRRLRELLEDFDVVATMQHMALIQRDRDERLRTDVRAALVASTLRLNSLDYARRRYCDEEDSDSDSVEAAHAYIDAYRCTKHYITLMLSKLRTVGLPEPSAGVFTSAVVLERLPASFFSAHFLYRLGYRFEGHAVSRLILEQLAWAYTAHSFVDVDVIEKIQATQAISCLKRQFPEVGRLYGFLSSKTHIGFDSHLEFLSVENDRNIVWHSKAHFSEFAQIILTLADLFGVIWEISQFQYIPNPETVELRDEKLCIKVDRPFLEQAERCLNEVGARMDKTNSTLHPDAARQ